MKKPEVQLSHEKLILYNFQADVLIRADDLLKNLTAEQHKKQLKNIVQKVMTQVSSLN